MTMERASQRDSRASAQFRSLPTKAIGMRRRKIAKRKSAPSASRVALKIARNIRHIARSPVSKALTNALALDRDGLSRFITVVVVLVCLLMVTKLLLQERGWAQPFSLSRVFPVPRVTPLIDERKTNPDHLRRPNLLPHRLNFDPRSVGM